MKSMRYLKCLICVFGIAVLAGCASDLQNLNNALSQANTVMSTPITAGPPLAPMSPMQAQELRSALQPQESGVALKSSVQGAAPVINKILAFSACFKGVDGSQYLRQYLAPGENFVQIPADRTRYVPTNTCMDVSRVDDWNMPALNALSFRVVYVSRVSGEGVDIFYTFVRQSDGAWFLFQNWLS